MWVIYFLILCKYFKYTLYIKHTHLKSHIMITVLRNIVQKWVINAKITLLEQNNNLNQLRHIWILLIDTHGILINYKHYLLSIANYLEDKPNILSRYI
jgi:CMP-2-keto-3-deoxyoctulosonic acid synthetase